jgi:hypothetical protein
MIMLILWILQLGYPLDYLTWICMPSIAFSWWTLAIVCRLDEVVLIETSFWPSFRYVNSWPLR